MSNIGGIHVARRKHFLFLCTVLMFTSLFFAGCGSDQKYAGKHITLGLYWFGESLDPAHDYDGWTVSRIGAGETLVRVAEDMTYAPQLSDAWKSESQNIWRFHIRRGVTFQNGKSLTAEDVVKSLKRTLEENVTARMAAGIKSIKADGEDVVIETEQPDAALAATLSDPAFIILDTDAPNPDTAPIFTGPYMVSAFKKGSAIALKAYAGYWNGAPGLDELTVRYIPDNTKRAMALQAGDIDLMQRVDTASRPLFENDKYQISQASGTRIFMADVNIEGTLKDPNLREGVAASIDYDALATLEGNGSTAAGEPFPPALAYARVAHPHRMDLPHAAECFQKAGFTKDAEGFYQKDGKRLSLKFATWGSKTAMYEALQAELRTAGIEVTLVKVPDENVKMQENGMDLLEQNIITAPTNNPYLFLDRVFRTGSRMNFGGYSNPALDVLIQKLPTEFDENKRESMIREAAELLCRDNAEIFLAFPANTMVGTAHIRNLTTFPIDYYVVTKDLTIE